MAGIPRLAICCDDLKWGNHILELYTVYMHVYMCVCVGEPWRAWTDMYKPICKIVGFDITQSERMLFKKRVLPCSPDI